MNKRSLPFVILALLVLTAGVLLLTARFSGGDPLQASTATIDPEASTALIDPAIWEALETQTEVKVLISLRELDLPIEQWTTDLRRQHAPEVQARVLAVLTENDFVLTRQFEISPALGGRITKSGMEKLAVHPDVVGIGRTGTGTLS